MRISSIFFQEVVLKNSLRIIRRGMALTSVVMAMVILNPGEAFPQALEAGKAIYEGKTNPKVKCVGCHGEDGKPTRKGRGAPDFSDPSKARVSDAHWFWQISEGKRRTKMRSHKKHLTEEQRWQVIAYLRTFAQ